MINILVTLVVQNSKSGDEAEFIKKEVMKMLPDSKSFIALNKYDKIHGSYMLDFAISYPGHTNKETIMYEMLKISSSIARPWQIFFDEQNPELIFTKMDSSKFSKAALNPILWGHIQIA